MNKRKILAFACAAATFFSAVSCKSVGIAKDIFPGEESTPEAASEPIQLATSPPLSTEVVGNFPDYPISYPTIEQTDIGDKYEAEEAVLEGDVTVARELESFSGSGYVTGFGEGSSVTFKVDAPSNQHYDLAFCIKADATASCAISLNESGICKFNTTDDGVFTLITLPGVFLVKGKSEITISSDGDMCLDYLGVSNNTSLRDISYNVDGELSNKNAGESAKKLMSFLTEAYGEYIITGQYVSDEKNEELDLIYRTTGKYPAIRFSDLSNAGNSFDSNYKLIDAAANWYRNGGIVGLMWHWESPGNQPSVYAKETDFKLSNAVTDLDIAEMTQEEIRGLYGEGKLSEECYGIILDIDNMSGQLLSLKNKGIPVLWRPLHEGSGDWYWWGASGASDYKWLWNLVYTRMTDYFGLDNLIWIWNGQSADTLVDKSTFDIAAVDIYLSDEQEFGSRYDQFAALQKLVGPEKLIALSECCCVPDVDASFRDKSVWSFFGLWYGDYIMNENGEFSDKYVSKDSFIRAYNSSGVITLDEYKEMKNGNIPAQPTETPTESKTEEF